MPKIENELISIIVPIYNDSKYVERCYESLIKQTYNNIEILLIDDGSTDDSFDTCLFLAENDSRVKVIHQDNGGVSKARNAGLNLICGDYFMFLDADDILHPNCLSFLIEACKSYDALIAFCDLQNIYNNQEKYEWNIFSELKKQNVLIDEKYSILGIHGHMSSCAALYHKELKNEARFDESIFVGEDSLYFIQLAVKAGKTIHVAAPLYGYYVYETSAVHGSYNERKYTEIAAWRRIKDLVYAIGGDFYISCSAKYYCVCRQALERYSLVNKLDKSVRCTLLKELRNNYYSLLREKSLSSIEKLKCTMLLCCPSTYLKIYVIHKGKEYDRI